VIVLDTNVLSELLRSHPHPAVLAWSETQNHARFAVAAVTEAELRFGLAILPDGRRKTVMTEAVDRIIRGALGGRVVAFDRPATVHYAAFMAARRSAGRPVAVTDAMIAATALAAGAETLATRNVKDFEGSGLDLLNPWHDP
jgi:toxin FitB